MDGGQESRLAPMQAGPAAEDDLAAFLRTGRIIGGPECRTFLRHCFDGWTPAAAAEPGGLIQGCGSGHTLV